jgi:HlyD family type I secretion membrane fusion protein
MNSDVRNKPPTGRRAASLEATVANTIAVVAEFAQHSRRAETPAAPSSASEGSPRAMNDSLRSAELARQSGRAATPAAPAAASTAAEGSPRAMSDSMRSSGLAQQSRRAPTPAATLSAGRGGPPAVSDSMRSAAIAGWSIIAIFFGGFGAWAMTAPLHGAAVANGFVRVEGNRKSIQHLDGGIVKQLNVKEGDRVKAGDVLIVLDDSQARAEYNVLSQQFLVLRATEERLKAELTGASSLTMPEDLKAAGIEYPDVTGIWNSQIHQFESRAAALAGQRSVIKEKIAQLEAQITGSEAQEKAYREQFESVRKERESLTSLVERGLIAKPRYLQLERSGVGLEGQAAETAANIAKARQAIAEQMQQMAQLDNERLTEVTKDLRDTQAKLLEVIPKLSNAKAVLSRIDIRSPYSGEIVGLNVFSVGGVINRGDKIMDIVPERDSLIVEAQIAVEDIVNVHPDMNADVHLIAYKARITPVVRGKVIQVSADRLTDKRADNPYHYYVALVRIDEKDLAEIPNVQLYPGMPVTVMIQTVERTALDYLVGPIVMQFNRAFRQK